MSSIRVFFFTFFKIGFSDENVILDIFLAESAGQEKHARTKKLKRSLFSVPLVENSVRRGLAAHLGNILNR
jgi:hypothetical protein